MPPRPPKSAVRQSHQPAVIAAEGDDSNLDPMDVVLGVVWAVVIPTVVYFLLYFAGMPVGGGGSAGTFEEQMTRQDELNAITQPPVTFREIELRIAWVEGLLQNRVPDYVKRANTTDDNHAKNFWQELAFRVLGVAKNELQVVEADIETSPEMRSHPEVRESIRRWLAHIGQEEQKIIKNNPFPDRLLQVQNQVIAERKGQ